MPDMETAEKNKMMSAVAAESSSKVQATCNVANRGPFANMPVENDLRDNIEEGICSGEVASP
ncbi:MAG: hypothetical protein ACP5E2_16340 [Terracidiphilus sp.]